jgi:serine/threonine-protein kinase PpkA
LDRDLTNPAMRSLEVRVLVTKTQLSSLIQALERVMSAIQKQQQEQIKLFEALQSVASATMKNPQQIGEAEKLAETGLLPKFIESLPYRSEILSLTEDAYASLTADQRASLEASLMAKLFQYRDINEQVDGWVKLNPGDPDSSKVYPLHLSYLP